MSSRGTCRHLLCQQSLVRTAGWTRHGAACSACVRGTVADRWLTWMVHVYSVSSSSLTVQLYSRSRFLRLPLMNRLNIFPESRPLWVWDRNNELSHQLEHWMSHWPRSPVPCTTSRSHGLRCRAAHHCCPVKLFLQQLRAKGSGIQGCPHPDPQTAKHCCLRVCVCVRVLRVLVARQGDYLSPFTATTWASGRVYAKIDVEGNQRERVRDPDPRPSVHDCFSCSVILADDEVAQMHREIPVCVSVRLRWTTQTVFFSLGKKRRKLFF